MVIFIWSPMQHLQFIAAAIVHIFLWSIFHYCFGQLLFRDDGRARDRAWHQGEAVLRRPRLRAGDGHRRLLILHREVLRVARRTGMLQLQCTVRMTVYFIVCLCSSVTPSFPLSSYLSIYMYIFIFEKIRRWFNVAVLLIVIDAHVKYHEAGKGVPLNAFRFKLFRNDLYKQNIKIQK